MINQTDNNVVDIVNNAVNYDLVFSELSKSLSDETKDHPLLHFGRREFLRDCRTIQIGSGRQTGKTTWLINMLHRNPDDAIIFFKDEYTRREAFNHWTNTFVHDSELAEKINQRMIAQRNFRQSIKTTDPFFQTEVMKKAPKYIMIDDSNFHLHFFVVSLYDWIEETADTNPIIIRMG